MEDPKGDLRVRPACPRDIPVLVEFNRGLARETEEKDLEPERLEAGVTAIFDDPSRGACFVAERDGEIVGCLCVTHEWSDWRNGLFWWIQSVYVAPGARKEGVFRLLYEDVAQRARNSREVCGQRLYVDRGNEVAMKVYGAVGMDPSHYRMFELDLVLGI